MAILAGLARSVTAIVSNLILENKESDNNFSSARFTEKKDKLIPLPAPSEITDQFKRNFKLEDILNNPSISEKIRNNPLFKLGIESISHILERDSLRRNMGDEHFLREAAIQGTRAYRLQRRLERIGMRFDELGAKNFQYSIEEISLKHQLTVNTLQNALWIGPQIAQKIPKICSSVISALPTPRFRTSGQELIQILRENPQLALAASPFGNLLSSAMLRNLSESGYCYRGVKNAVNSVFRGSGGLSGGSAVDSVRQLTYGKLSKHFISVEITPKDLAYLPKGTIACYQRPGDFFDPVTDRRSYDGHVQLKTSKGWASTREQLKEGWDIAYKEIRRKDDYKIYAFIPADYLKIALKGSTSAS